MKRFYLFLAAAAAILTGCTKDTVGVSDGIASDGFAEVSITASVPEAMTKAAQDNDGEAAKVNHWIMEVRDKDGALYNRQEETVGTDSIGELSHKFTVRLVKNQTYDILFWADTEGAYETDDLTDISYKEDEPFTYYANKDSRDAFSCSVNYTSKTSEAVTATLTRPFGQLNIVTTDLDMLWKTTNQNTSAGVYSKFKPKNLVVKAKFPTTFNVKTQTCGEISTTTLVLKADSMYAEYGKHAEKSTMFMDYIFSSQNTKDVVDFDFFFESDGNAVEYAFSAIPVQRNYRTNILGNFLSNEAEWTVTIDPVFKTPEYDKPYFVAKTIAEAQTQAKKSTYTQIEVSSEAVADYEAKVKAGTITPETIEIGGSSQKVVKFVLTANSPTNEGFVLPKAPDGHIWYITNETGYPTQTLDVAAADASEVIIDTPNTETTLNGTSYASVVSSTSDNTLIIKDGVTVEKLTVKKGNVEVFGDVNTIIDETSGGFKLIWHVSTLEAFNKALSGTTGKKADKIVLEANLTATEAIEVGYELELDLNGYTISAGTLALSKGLVTVCRGGKLTVNDNAENLGGIDGKDSYAAFLLTKKGETSDGDVAELVINGGNFSGKYYAICGNGSRHNTKLTINGGKFSGTEKNDNLAIFNPQEGSVNITGGEFTGYASAIELRAGTLTITGGKFTATAPEFSYKANKSGNTVTGAAIAQSMHSSAKALAVFIKGGEFFGKMGFAQVNTTGKQPVAPDYVTIKINGGRFNGDIFSQEKDSIIASGQFLLEPDSKYIVSGSTAKKTGAYYEIVQAKNIYDESAGLIDGEWDMSSETVVVGRDQTKVCNFIYAYADNNGAWEGVNGDLKTLYIANSVGSFPATFCGFAKKLEKVYFEGGSDMNFGRDLFYGCVKLTDIYFDKLPTKITGSLTQNSTTFFGSDGPAGIQVTVHVPNGWAAAGYPTELKMGDNNTAIVVIEDR